jgi:hypothetical protein
MVNTLISIEVNIFDISQISGFLHGKETPGHADAGYLGIPKRSEVKLLLVPGALRAG